MSSPPVVWRGRTMASRSAERRELLLAAAYDLLGTEGAAATTMRAVCRRAGLSLRYFYESFADRDALLVEVHDRITHELVETVTAALMASRDAEMDRLRGIFDAATRWFADDPRRGRILFRETLADDTLRAHGATAVPAFVALVATQLEPHQTEAVSPDRLELAIRSLSGALVALFLDWLEGSLDNSREDIVEYAAQLSAAILQL
ncbi:TetR/AcrR family transcriptional regulator [Nocardia farcinica]|uniref:TetR/AcrR family transcriptional regulator n=1 Tax=Nocardia farcinica TaxID=37329 RepID=UPI001893F6FF|nr:TetR/AcrR family transcriptional regulator [Nocardia farcinica]MBF6183647.1 TetR/AcrR family transcriptional regulator [Nocardia farcinica]MBF6309490.1 TetR/AcrR family transcriptional regulator [Nocardia farcinica]MBF6406688.1 TetR/AcrR family transcriptional regulator [Nocardia farcinica]UEX20541.1 TetR/AcrR family transcriptional regulator [Nocardia farcinica]